MKICVCECKNRKLRKSLEVYFHQHFLHTSLHQIPQILAEIVVNVFDDVASKIIKTIAESEFFHGEIPY